MISIATIADEMVAIINAAAITAGTPPVAIVSARSQKPKHTTTDIAAGMIVDVVPKADPQFAPHTRRGSRRANVVDIGVYRKVDFGEVPPTENAAFNEFDSVSNQLLALFINRRTSLPSGATVIAAERPTLYDPEKLESTNVLFTVIGVSFFVTTR